MNDFEEGMIKKVNQNINTIFIKGIMAGFFIAIASMLSIVVSSSITNYSISKLLSALVFPIGLILVVLFKTELFTGNCLVIIPLINKKIKINYIKKSKYPFFRNIYRKSDFFQKIWYNLIKKRGRKWKKKL